MILSMKPLSLSEAKTLAGDLESKPELNEYFKQFCTLDEKKSKELGDAIRGLNNPRIREDVIAKVIDFLPKDHESLLKISNDVSLDEKEIESILAIVREY